jgi:two-component system, cell cycle response regulator DivK
MTERGHASALVVDDHELNLKLLQRVLELEGLEVTAVGSMAEAESALVDQLPDVIVLDLQLPDGDGLDLARRLKADPQTAGCAIVACTAGAMRGDRERALEAGCDAYVSKPIDTRGFAALVSSFVTARRCDERRSRLPDLL